MRLSRLALPVALGAAALLAVPASAVAPGCYEKVAGGTDYCEQKVFFHVGSASKAGNVSSQQGSFPTWDTTAPKSVSTGSGGGFVSNGAMRQQDTGQENVARAVFKGTYTGALDTLDVTMYLFAPGRQNEKTYHGAVELLVDGKTVLDMNIDGLPLTPGGSAVLKTDFVLAGLPALLAEAGVADGEDVRHAVELVFTTFPLVTTTAVVVYDAAEAPSGMVFNTTKSLEGRTVIGGDPEEEPVD